MKKELMDYIQDVLSKGFKPEQVKQTLRQAGYAEADIQEAFAGISQPSHTLTIFITLCILTSLFVLILFLLFNFLGTSPIEMPQKIITPSVSPQSGCNEKTPGQWCYQVITESVTSGSCSATKEECMNTYYADLAVANKDEKLCDNIAQPGKDWCISNVASKKNDLAVCNNVADPAEKSFCIGTVGGQQGNKTACDSAPSKDECNINYAMASNDPSICALISSQDKKQQCEFFAIPPPPVPE